MDLLVSYYLQEDKIPKEMDFSLKDLYKDLLLSLFRIRTSSTFGSFFLYQDHG